MPHPHEFWAVAGREPRHIYIYTRMSPAYYAIALAVSSFETTFEAIRASSPVLLDAFADPWCRTVVVATATAVFVIVMRTVIGTIARSAIALWRLLVASWVVWTIATHAAEWVPVEVVWTLCAAELMWLVGSSSCWRWWVATSYRPDAPPQVRPQTGTTECVQELLMRGRNHDQLMCSMHSLSALLQSIGARVDMVAEMAAMSRKTHGRRLAPHPRCPVDLHAPQYSD